MNVLRHVRRWLGSPAPEMTPKRWRRVIEIADEALKRPDASDRRRFLGEACRGDRALREEVEKLLRYEDAEAPLSPLAPLSRPRFTPARERGEPEGTFGPFHIEKILGRGGMGVVALVTDPELGRRVALKILRREKVSDDLLRRFDDERRLLARLDHPAIARIYGGGDVDGVPWFTMEAVDGEPIDADCDRRRLGVEERLRLLLPVCSALEHAHRHLIVHRDLKPSNLLVTRDGEPKVLDFGIAKSLDEVDGTRTATGHPVLTLGWASPEQIRQLPLTTASDVYALGVLLYELLCGHPPYVLDGDFLENARRVCEDEPPPPSSRATVAREDWTDGDPCLVPPAEIARLRGTAPERLRRRLRGDLDAVVLKALRKDPGRRYGSMIELAADLRRHLEGRPVTARRGGWLDRTVKLVRRHRRRLAAAALVVTAVTVVTVLRLGDVREVRRLAEERREATAAAATATRQADVMRHFVRNLLRAADPDSASGRSLTAAEILADAETRIREDMGRDLPLTPFSQGPGHDEVLAHVLEAIGLSHQAYGRWGDAGRLLRESLELRTQFYRGDHPLIARAFNNLGAVEHQTGNLADAERLYRRALTMKERLGQDETQLLKVRGNLASILGQRGSFDEAEHLYRQILDSRIRLYGPDHADVATSLRSLAVLLLGRGEPDAAEPLLRRALAIRERHYGPHSTKTAAVLSILGRVLHAQGLHQQAEAVMTRALAIREQKLGDAHPLVASSRRDLALLLFDLGEPETAAVIWDRAMAILRQEGGWEVADAESRLGEGLLTDGRPGEAEICLHESWEALRRLRGEDAAVTQAARRRLSSLSPQHD